MSGGKFDPVHEGARAERLIGAEIAVWEEQLVQRTGARERWHRETLAAFRAHLQPPEAVTVNFSGGLTQDCIAVTRPYGPYQVVYLPRAGYFSLCVQSQFGPLDIGIHGKAIGCFDSI